MSWDLDVQTWMSKRPGCPGTWMSGDLDVRDLSVRDLFVQDLDVRQPITVVTIRYAFGRGWVSQYPHCGGKDT